MANQTFQNAYLMATTANTVYTRNRARWQYLLSSYLGGEDYRRGAYLQRYQLESDGEYNNRLSLVPLDNQCRGIVSLYTSLLFRLPPERDLGSISSRPDAADFLEDADLDGRSWDAFMRETAALSAVFGNVWIAVVKPNVGAVTQADEISAGVRPYVSLLTPLAVTDWRWTRQPNGVYVLTYIKYVEEATGSQVVIREWTPETVVTYITNTQSRTVDTTTTEPNGLGRLPFVCVYSERSQIRGIGSSMIDDIADQQRMIYNELAEVYDSIRLDTHPSLVATASTNVTGAAAGQVITIEENSDPNLKPYVLQFQGGQISSIYESIANRRGIIDTMANVGGVRTSETRELSGRAMEIEMTLLNARLAALGDNMELAEEQVWQLFCEYVGAEWTGTVNYADDFSLKTTENRMSQLQGAIGSVTTPERRDQIESAIMDLLELDTPDTELNLSQQHPETTPADRAEHIQSMIMEGYEDDEILDIHPEITSADIQAAKQALLNSNG